MYPPHLSYLPIHHPTSTFIHIQLKPSEGKLTYTFKRKKIQKNIAQPKLHYNRSGKSVYIKMRVCCQRECGERGVGWDEMPGERSDVGVSGVEWNVLRGI